MRSQNNVANDFRLCVKNLKNCDDYCRRNMCVVYHHLHNFSHGDEILPNQISSYHLIVNQSMSYDIYVTQSIAGS